MSFGDRAGSDHADEASSSRTDPLIGALVNGKFRIRDAIARGGMGRIYYAIQEPLGRPVALKVVQGDGANEHESQFLKRFVQEASILAKLQHPNVVTLFDYGRVEGPIEQYFIAMEYLAGETLAARMKARGVMTPAEVLVLTRQIARGLREAHVRGIVHRDLKPSNIILVRESDGSEIVKLVDFGIGKVMELGGEQDLTQDGFVVGTPRYMAPEQFDGTATPASDLYSLGSILYQALTGRLPFKGATMSEFMVAKFAQDIPRFRETNPNVSAPESLEMLVFQLLARRPEDRPSSEQLFAALAQCEMDVFGGGVSGVTGPHPAWSTGPLPAITPGSLPPVQVAPSNPPTGSGVRANPDALRVPYTRVASANALGLTPSPMARSARPPPQEEPRGPKAGAILAIVLPVLLASGGGAFYWFKTHSTPSAAPPVDSVTQPQPQPQPVATAAESFTLSIDSSPSGATVSEGGKAIGTTPMQLTVERASVAAGPRTFVIAKDGYQSTSIVQGPSDETVRSTVALAQDPVQPVKSHGAGEKPHVNGGTPPATVVKPPPGPSPGTDIRLKR
jgi:serine/threonine protein kinase